MAGPLKPAPPHPTTPPLAPFAHPLPSTHPPPLWSVVCPSRQQQRFCVPLPLRGPCAGFGEPCLQLCWTMLTLRCFNGIHPAAVSHPIPHHFEEKPETQALPLSSIFLAYLVQDLLRSVAGRPMACFMSAHRCWALHPFAAWLRSPASGCSAPVCHLLSSPLLPSCKPEPSSPCHALTVDSAPASLEFWESAIHPTRVGTHVVAPCPPVLMPLEERKRLPPFPARACFIFT